MKSLELVMMALVFSLVLPPPMAALAQDAARVASQPSQESLVMPEQLLPRLVGSWEGTCRTWFEPGKRADESRIKGTIRSLFGGQQFRHEYVGTIQGKLRHGDETMALNSVTKQFEVAWVDDYHMNYAIMFSVGGATERGFAVTGKYDVGPDTPPWGWRTEFELVDDNYLTITAFNIMPDGQEAKGVETTYTRVAP